MVEQTVSNHPSNARTTRELTFEACSSSPTSKSSLFSSLLFDGLRRWIRKTTNLGG